VTGNNVDRLAWLRKTLEFADVDLMREMLRVLVKELISAEADAMCGAPYGKRSAERVNRTANASSTPVLARYRSPSPSFARAATTPTGFSRTGGARSVRSWP